MNSGQSDKPVSLDKQQAVAIRKERRKNVRVVPEDSAPVIIYIDGEECKLADVSAGGVAFASRVHGCNLSLPEQGYYFKAEILLPEQSEPSAVFLEVLGQGANGLTRCAFRDLDSEIGDILDTYVTDRLEDVFADYFG